MTIANEARRAVASVDAWPRLAPLAGLTAPDAVTALVVVEVSTESNSISAQETHHPVGDPPLMWVAHPQLTGMRGIASRCLDLVGATVLLLLAAPVMMAIAIVLRVSSRGPALYRSKRLGVHGREFCVYKFRSMYEGADCRIGDLFHLNQSEGGVLFKMHRDPRVTRVGRVLRKYSLDELPQLLNVLSGSMSLVGPRPPLRNEVEQYRVHVHRRLLVKPGMTGLWQISGRSDLTWDDSVRLDLYYVENWSLGLNIRILVRTPWVVLRSRGAY